MITVFNRREVYVGFSMKDFGRMRSVLSENQIKYTYKVVSQYNDSRNRGAGTAGINLDFACEYYLYVHKKDYEEACYLIQSSVSN